MKNKEMKNNSKLLIYIDCWANIFNNIYQSEKHKSRWFTFLNQSEFSVELVLEWTKGAARNQNMIELNAGKREGRQSAKQQQQPNKCGRMCATKSNWRATRDIDQIAMYYTNTFNQ